MCDINIYRLRIGIFQMPSAKKFKFRAMKKSSYKKQSYSIILHMILLVSFSLLFSEGYLSECRLPQKVEDTRRPLRRKFLCSLHIWKQKIPWD